MTLVTLADVLRPAVAGGYAVPGLVCQGWEDMRAYVMAAEAEQAPVILQAGPGCREHTPLPILGKMFRLLAEGADVPVVAHLDHGTSLEECRAALDAGFTSLMLDGSRLLDQAYHDALLRLDRDTPIVFQCHHGMRSQGAAEYFAQQGFRHLYNLIGGIEAWSQEIDPEVGERAGG